MVNIIFLFKIISIIAFLFYGLACIFSQKLVVEFKRYGLEKFRVLTGILEVLGALGILVGFVFPIITILASLGISLLMLSGIIVRMLIKDSIIQILPAAVLGIINFIIFYFSIIL